jgi:hypothetical protein
MLRVGIVLQRSTSNAWVAKVIEDIQSSEFARVEAVIIVRGLPAPRKASLLAQIQDIWKHKLFLLYEDWDYRRNKTTHDALAPSNLAYLLASIPVVLIDRTSHSIPDDQVVEIESRNLDLVLNFASSHVRELARMIRYGILSFRFRGEEDHGDSPPLFWQVFDRKPVSPSALQIDCFAENRMAYEGFSATDPASLYRTRNPIYWKTAEAAVRAIRELHLGGQEYIESLPVSGSHGRDVSSGKRTLNSLSMVSFLGREVVRWSKARATSLQSSIPLKWCIGIRRRTAERPFDDPSAYNLMTSAKDRFYADPFLFERDGRTFLFFEDFRYPEGRAIISCCELDTDGTPGAPFEVLRRPYHLSYPFLFEDEGEIYMIPETRGNRAIELYRATEFPNGWIQEGVLISDINAVDTTLQRIDGKLWMFTGISNGNYSNSDELAIFSSDSLTGPWKPHPRNPVVTDVQRARPAGMLFYESGRLIRPSQDCGKAYGYALVFSEILTLTETHYEERLISRIIPESIPHAISNHTYNRTDRFEVVDRTLPVRIAEAREL